MSSTIFRVPVVKNLWGHVKTQKWNNYLVHILVFYHETVSSLLSDHNSLINQLIMPWQYQKKKKKERIEKVNLVWPCECTYADSRCLSSLVWLSLEAAVQVERWDQSTVNFNSWICLQGTNHIGRVLRQNSGHSTWNREMVKEGIAWTLKWKRGLKGVGDGGE